MEKSLTIVISAYNEEQNVETAVKSAVSVAERHVPDHEILLFNDGSTDSTGKIIDRLAVGHPRIRAIVNAQNRGLAAVSRQAIGLARKQYLTWLSAANSVDPESIGKIYGAIGAADILVAYMQNPSVRYAFRRSMSGSYTLFLNFLFRLNIKYYTGPSVYRTDLLRATKTFAEGHDFFAELLIRCLKNGASYQQMPFTHKIVPHRKSKAVSLHNVLSTVCSTARLAWSIHCSKSGGDGHPRT